MEDVKQKLLEHRLKKRRKEKLNDIKNGIKKCILFKTRSNEGNNIETESINDQSQICVSDSNEEGSNDVKSDMSKQSAYIKYISWTLYLLLWVMLCIMAVELEFGLVFLLFSALFGIYFSTRNGPKMKNEISAYSVFNKNFESIDGTIKADHFEREIYGYVR